MTGKCKMPRNLADEIAEISRNNIVRLARDSHESRVNAFDAVVESEYMKLIKKLRRIAETTYRYVYKCDDPDLSNRIYAKLNSDGFIVGHGNQSDYDIAIYWLGHDERVIIDEYTQSMNRKRTGHR